MREQIRNTITSLSPAYQRGIRPEDYEVLLLENSSDESLEPGDIAKLPENFTYILREESSQSPAAAINQGISIARGLFIGLMIDGAYVMTPGVLRNAMLATKASEHAFITVPTYHLGPGDQAITTLQGFGLEKQREALADIGWPDEGYKLFSIGGFCPSNPKGFFPSILESNCYFTPRASLEEIGGADESFQQAGGGSLNLDMTLKLGTRAGSVYFTLGGEGVFHQYHGGVTTSKTRDEFVAAFDRELHDKWDSKFHYFARNPIVIGSFSEYSHELLQQSSQLMQKRFRICRKNNWPVWEDAQDHDL